MLNKTGVTKTSYLNISQILFNTDKFVSVGVIVDDLNVAAGADGKKIMKAGTPLFGDIADRTNATHFTFETTTDEDTNAVYEIQIKTAFDNDEVITIGGVAYTKKASENTTNKEFEGATAALQVTSLLKMIAYTGFAVTGSTDKLIFTQIAPYAGRIPKIEKTSTTGDLGTLTQTTAEAYANTSNAVGVLLHDIDLTAGDTNGTLLIFGFVDLSKLDTATKNLITTPVKKALAGKVTFLQ